MHKNVVQQIEEQYVDDNGKVLTRTIQKTFTEKVSPDSFYNTFFDYIKWMLHTNSLVAVKVMICLMRSAEFNTGRIELATCTRDSIIKEIGIDRTAFSRAIRLLIDNEAITKCVICDQLTGEIREEKGAYMINPTMFWKGDLTTRSKLIVDFKVE